MPGWFRVVPRESTGTEEKVRWRTKPKALRFQPIHFIYIYRERDIDIDISATVPPARDGVALKYIREVPERDSLAGTGKYQNPEMCTPPRTEASIFLRRATFT